MEKRECSFHVGIDLGTTNTVFSQCMRPKRLGGMCRPKIRPIEQYTYQNQTGSLPSLPSVLFFGEDGKVIVGAYAKSKKEDGASSRVLYNTKIDMGQKVEYANGYNPVKAAAEILKVCYASILTFVPLSEDFPDVTITVPASFTQSQIADTLEAAKQAGFRPDKISILEEPVAALFAYINDQMISMDETAIDFSEKKRVMVYDIGGGTCDVCVVDMQITEDESYSIEFIATNRYTEFGGNDFDEAVAIGLLNKLFKKFNITESSISSIDTKNDLIAKLLPFCEQYKIQYAKMLRVNGENNVGTLTYAMLDDFMGKGPVELEVTFEEYLEYTKVFFEDNYTHPTRDLTDKMRDKNVIKPVYQILQKLKESGERSIDCIFLTGGMSEYLPIEKALAEFCGVPIIKAESPMEAVAAGASMSAYIRTTSIQRDDNPVNIHDEFNAEEVAEAGYNRPKLAESIFIDIENMIPLKIIDSNTSIPSKGVVQHEFKVGASGVCFNLFAGANEFDPEMRILYDYSKKFDYLVKPNTKATIRYEIDENRFLRMYLDLQDERRQTYELTVDTTY